MPGNQPVALVTGASRGIGRGIALELARRGFAVGVNYVRNREAATEVVGQITAAQGIAVAVQADIGDAEDRDRLMTGVLSAFGRIDLLVNNAGITSPGRKDLLEATEESWDEVFAVNLKGPFFLAQAVARQMLAQAASPPQGEAERAIINVSSISSFAVSTNRADYCLAKSALPMLTQLLATRLAEHGIRVYDVCPGVIESDMTGPVRDKYDRLIAEGLSPIRRWGRPEDVARVVATLATGGLPYCTGQTVYVDGGFHVRRL
jgi:NAD(P)-dependent dehydrogenase (short-subunit alcohol dehydrogenase family)